MALIKNADALGRTGGAVVLDLGDIARQAEALRAAAIAQAEGVVEEARRERERLIAGAADIGFKEGEARGHEAGLHAGFDEGRRTVFEEHARQIAAIEAGWTRALDDFESRRARILEESRRDVLRLALEIAQRATHRAVAADEAAVEAQLAAAIHAVLEPHSIVALIHPDDAELAAAAMPRLVARLSGSPHIEIRPDPALAHGECIIRTTGGEVDARLSTQLDRIAETLLPGSAADRAESPAIPDDATDNAQPDSSESDASTPGPAP